MLTRFVLAAMTCGLVALFGFSYVVGEMRGTGWLFFVGGALAGLLLVVTTRRVSLPGATARRSARICFALAVLFLAWGLLRLISGGDPVTGTPFSGDQGVISGTLLMLSAVPALAGLLILAMRSK